MTDAMDELRAIAMRAGDKWTPTGLPRVSMVRAEACSNQVYEPMLHLVLQGTKSLSVGDQLLRFEPASYFLIPVDVPAIGEISSVIEEINNYQSIIASAVEEQSATAAEMNRSVVALSDGAGGMAANISGIANASLITNEGITQSQAAVVELSTMAQELQRLVHQFRVK